MHRRVAALPVNDKSCGQRFHTAILIRQRFVANHNRIGNLVLRKVRPNHLPTLIVHGHTQRRKSAGFVLLLEFVEPRNLNLAGSTPGCPKIEQHHFTFVVAQFLRLANGIGKGKIDRRFWVGRFSGSLRLSEGEKGAAEYRQAEQFAPGQAVVQFHQCIPFCGSRPYGQR